MAAHRRGARRGRLRRQHKDGDLDGHHAGGVGDDRHDCDQHHPCVNDAREGVNTIMTDYKFAPDNVTVAAGKVPIAQKNAGGVEHEFVLVKTDKAAGSFRVEGSQIDEDKAGTSIGEIEESP